MDEYSPRDAEVIRGATLCLGGRVLVGGCGLANTRPAMLERWAIAESETVDVDEEVVARALEADASVPEEASVFEALFDGTTPAPRGDSVDVGDIRDRVREAVENGESWDAVLIDVADRAIEADPALHADLKQLVARRGRVVVITQDLGLEIPGFKKAIRESGELYHVLIFEQTHPDDVDPFAGFVRLPGRGWVDRRPSSEGGGADGVQGEGQAEEVRP